MRRPDHELDTAVSGIFQCENWGYRNCSEEWQEQANARAVDIINAALPSLSQVEGLALMHVKLGASYRQAEDVQRAYLRARNVIGIKLRAADFS